jgi:hypothetical protein
MDVRNEALNICGDGAAILSSCTDGVWSEFIVGEYEVALSLKEWADTSTTRSAGTGTTSGLECSWKYNRVWVMSVQEIIRFTKKQTPNTPNARTIVTSPIVTGVNPPTLMDKMKQTNDRSTTRVSARARRDRTRDWGLKIRNSRKWADATNSMLPLKGLSFVGGETRVAA